eukprot:scaffold153_cov314-Prasinococcus_capsulatus_cf.AAC.4
MQGHQARFVVATTSIAPCFARSCEFSYHHAGGHRRSHNVLLKLSGLSCESRSTRFVRVTDASAACRRSTTAFLPAEQLVAAPCGGARSLRGR